MAEYNEFLLELMKNGRSYEDTVVDLKDRIKEYKKACSEHEGQSHDNQNGD